MQPPTSNDRKADAGLSPVQAVHNDSTFISFHPCPPATVPSCTPADNLSPFSTSPQFANAQVPVVVRQDAFKSLTSRHLYADYYNPDYHFSRERKGLLREVYKVCQIFGFSLTTYYQALTLIDVLTSRFGINHVEIRETARVCVFMAAKAVESRSKLPRVSRYIFETGCVMNRKRLITCEFHLASLLGFQFNLPSAYEVFSFLASVGLVLKKEVAALAVTDPKAAKLPADVEKLAFLFIELSSQNYEFMQFSSHVMAAACVMLARRGVELEPWPPELVDVTRLTAESLKACSGLLTKRFRETKQQHVRHFFNFYCSLSGTFGILNPPKIACPKRQKKMLATVAQDSLTNFRKKKIRKTRGSRLSLPPTTPPQDSPFSLPDPTANQLQRLPSFRWSLNASERKDSPPKRI